MGRRVAQAHARAAARDVRSGRAAGPGRRSIATFRFYEELNDFLRPELRRHSFDYAFTGSPAVKDAIEAIGVPHTEVDLVLIDGESVGFGRHLNDGNRVAVYPVFERLDIAPLARLRRRPLRRTRFVLDVHLGTLARYLRLLGFDTLYRNDYDDAEIARIAHDQGRIVLTRDRGLLKHRAVSRGRWVRGTQPAAQLRETLAAFDLSESLKPFTRCAICNGRLRKIGLRLVGELVPARVRERHRDFARCASCGRVYWPGTHVARIRSVLSAAKIELPPAP